VLIDVESLYNLINHRHPVHAFFHTYLGATLAIAAVVLLFMGARWFARRFWLPDLFKWQELTLAQVSAGAMLGGYSHVVLDSGMHGDIEPLSPFSSANPLLGVIPLDTLHIACLALGMFGLVVVGVRRLVT
jgi:hypothetical protein